MIHLAGMASAAHALGPGGVFARSLPGYEARPGQTAMAERVEQCLLRDGIAMIEAGTGTGKTLAYLVPALLDSGRRRIVISTATRALQDQLYHRELALAQRVLGTSKRAAVLKGLPNYVCRRRAEDFFSRGEALEARFERSLDAVGPWLERTTAGAIEEVPAVEEGDPLWGRITASSELRVGTGCRHFEQCFVTRAKREAAAADLLVVNHHLFFADLALRGAHPARVLPDYDAVIFDEAHQLEEVATQYFGLQVSSGRLERLAEDALRVLEETGDSGARAVHQRLHRATTGFFGELARPFGSAAAEPRVYLEQDFLSGPRQEAWFLLDTALEGLSFALERGEERAAAGPAADAAGLLLRRASGLREQLARSFEAQRNRVAWLERTPRAQALGSSPVDVSALLSEHLFEVVPAVVLTSATLASRAADEEHSAFEFERRRLGLAADQYRVDELVVGSPFDFESQALLYTPNDLPLPGEGAFPAAFADRCRALIEQSGGGAFVLTTSMRSMQAVFRSLREALSDRFSVSVQGQAPKRVLLERFAAAKSGVLVATLGFWQGVDVPGEALRLVVLEKAPFPVPTDPLIVARSLHLERAGESPFARLHLPLAQLILKQGFGRLIRTRADRGVVALLDARVHRRGYGKQLLRVLPPARRATSLDEVAAFWAGEAASDGALGPVPAPALD